MNKVVIIGCEMRIVIFFDNQNRKESIIYPIFAAN